MALVAGCLPVSVALIRQMMWRNTVKSHLRNAHRVDSLATYDTSIGAGKEVVAAFFDKRAPAVTGKASAMLPSHP